MPRALLLVATSVTVVVLAPFAGGQLDGEAGRFIFWNLRVPRALMGALVGGTLSLVGAVFQAVLHNPLATPSTVGTTAGATLGALGVLVLGASGTVAGLPVVAAAAFAGALIVTLALTAVAARGRARTNDILLVGIAITLAASALSTGLRYASDMSTLFDAVQWSLGHLPQVGYRGIVLILPFVVPVVIVLLLQLRALETLVGGEDRAHSQGVDVPRLRSLMLGTGALGVAACVAWCGPIPFVGLIVPHMVRLWVGAGARMLLPLSLIAGAGFLTLSDTAARTLLAGREIPVGVVTAALGAPLLVWLVARRDAA